MNSPKPLAAERAFDLRWSSHRVRPVVRPVDFPVPVVAAHLIDALPEFWEADDLTDGTRYHYVHSVTSLLRSLSTDRVSPMSLANGEARWSRQLHTWERELKRAYGPTSHVPKVRAAQIRKLMRFLIARGDSIAEDVRLWALGEQLHESGFSAPLDEFSNAECARIRIRSREVIRDMEARLKRGWALTRAGDDPRIHGWCSLPNALWATRWLVGDASVPMPGRVARALEAGALDSLPNARELRQTKAGGRAIAVLGTLMSYVYPTPRDLAAFVSLLQLATGAAPEEIRNMRYRDIEIDDEVVRIRVLKARAHKARTLRLVRTGDGDSWKAGDIVLRLLAATVSVRLVPSENDNTAEKIFVTARRDRRGRLFIDQPYAGGTRLAELVHDIDPPISKPHDARRLRKTVKSMRGAVLRSLNGAAGDDHSVEVFRSHYAQTTTVQILAAQTIMTAQRQVVERLQSGPLFVGELADRLRDVDDSSVATAARTVASESPTERRLNVTHCSDPLASPFEIQGRICSQKPLMCFACPNAIVFEDHLPRLLALRDVFKGYEAEMSPEQFAVQYGQQLANLLEILKSFPQDKVAAASVAKESVHVPLKNRGTHT